MKKAKKFLSVFIAIVMTLSLAIPAFAADSYKITIENSVEGHTYEAYQIFTGDLHGTVLSNIKWGNGQTNHKVGDDATAVAETLNAEADVEEFAKTLTLGTPEGTSKYVKDEANPTASTYVIENLTPGYYLIKDADNSLTGNIDDAYTKFIVKIVGDATAKPKSAMPTVDKQVRDEYEDRDYDSNSPEGWGETADHAIYESFQYKLIANLPNDKNLEAYKKYKLVFHDTMSGAITFENIESVIVYDANNNPTPLNEASYACTAVTDKAGGEWTLTIADLVALISNIKDARVEVIYNAHLNETADLSANAVNDNRVYLEYSNNPNAGGENDMGKTSEDIVWVFTFTMDNAKIDGDTKAPLGGAGFELHDAATDAKIGLIFDETLNAYRPLKPAKEGETPETAEEMFSAEGTGLFNIVGLDAGKYTLKETTVPGGYNKCNDISIEIKAIHTENPRDTSTASCVITKLQDGTSTNTFTIENNQGATLPETGGMGTVIFYVVGGLLVAAAVVLIITRKRMSTEK